METAGQRAHVDGARQLELPVVAVPKERRIDDVFLDLRESGMGRCEVALTVIVEACQSSHVAGEAKPHLPNVHECCEAAEC